MQKPKPMNATLRDVCVCVSKSKDTEPRDLQYLVSEWPCHVLAHPKTRQLISGPIPVRPESPLHPTSPSWGENV